MSKLQKLPTSLTDRAHIVDKSAIHAITIVYTTVKGRSRNALSEFHKAGFGGLRQKACVLPEGGTNDGRAGADAKAL